MALVQPYRFRIPKFIRLAETERGFFVQGFSIEDYQYMKKSERAVQKFIKPNSKSRLTIYP
jgi:hypothetical protein